MFDSRGLIFWSLEIGVGWGRASTMQRVLSDHIALSRAFLSYLLNSMVPYNDCDLIVSSRLSSFRQISRPGLVFYHTTRTSGAMSLSNIESSQYRT